MPSDGWVPTLGPMHEDAQHLNFPYDHYHIDWRFIGDEEMVLARKKTESPHGTVLTSTGNYMIEGKPVMKRRKMRRLMPDHLRIKDVKFLSFDRSQNNWQNLEKAHSCARLKPGNICPHRGIDLTPFIKPDGTVICPGHGLKWDTKTGELLAHHCA